MENRENKIIADKINSLDFLPEGYNPNLEAKWALLQKKEENQKVVFPFERNTWLKIAACFFILLVSSILLMNRNSQNKSDVATTIPNTTPLKLQNEIIENSSEKIADKRTTIKEFKSHTRKIKSSIPIQQQSNTLFETPLAVSQPIDTSKKIETQIELVIDKPKKSRYVQLDFEDAVIQPEAKNTFAQGFQFRIGLKSTNSERQNSKDYSALKLKHNF